MKKRHGKGERRKPLPKIVDDQLNNITISPVDYLGKQDIVDREIAQLILRESEPDRFITVGKRVQLLHPFVQTTKESLKESRPNDYGRVSPHWQFTGTYFDLQVSPQNVSRALKILQTLTSSMQDRGYQLKKKSDDSRHPHFDVLDEEFYVAIRESSKRKQKEAKQSQWSYEKYDYTPSGVLELCINYGSYSSDATLRDTIKKPLENRLNEAIIAMLRIVDQRRKFAEIARVEAAAKAKRKEIAIEKEIERRSDSARINRLQQLTQLWEKHRLFSRFVDAVRLEAESQAPKVNPDTIKWLRWADEFLSEIDPFHGGEDLPVYTITEKEREQLRRECESNWSQWSETFRH